MNGWENESDKLLVIPGRNPTRNDSPDREERDKLTVERLLLDPSPGFGFTVMVWHG